MARSEALVVEFSAIYRRKKQLSNVSAFFSTKEAFPVVMLFTLAILMKGIRHVFNSANKIGVPRQSTQTCIVNFKLKSEITWAMLTAKNTDNGGNQYQQFILSYYPLLNCFPRRNLESMKTADSNEEVLSVGMRVFPQMHHNVSKILVFELRHGAERSRGAAKRIGRVCKNPAKFSTAASL